MIRLYIYSIFKALATKFIKIWLHLNKKYLCEVCFLSSLILFTSCGNEFLLCLALPTRLLASGMQGNVLLIFIAPMSGSQKVGGSINVWCMEPLEVSLIYYYCYTIEYKMLKSGNFVIYNNLIIYKWWSVNDSDIGV